MAGYLNFSLFTLHFSLFTLHSSLFTLHFSLFTLHSSAFSEKIQHFEDFLFGGGLVDAYVTDVA